MLALMMILGIMPICVMAADLSVSGGRIDIIDRTVGPYTVQYLDVYKQTSFEAVSIVSAVQNGTVIDVVLAEGTDPSEALQAGFGGSGAGLILNHSGNKGALSNGVLTLTVGITPFGGGRPQGPTTTYTINFTIGQSSSGGEEKEPTIAMTTDLSEEEVRYTVGKPTTALTVAAEQSKGEYVTYQWYSNTIKNTEGSIEIQGATSESYTPSADSVGTKYYYAVASCGDLTAISKIAKITVEAPIVKFTTNLSESEVKCIQNKPAAALTVAAEYTGITDDAVTYQWYSNTEKSTVGATAIPGATSESYTPVTDTLGTTYYYALASCGGLFATSNIAKITVEAATLLPVTDNVIDIADKTVWSRSSYYAKVTNIEIIGADVESAAEDGTTVDIVLEGNNPDDLEFSFEFGTSLNKAKMSGHTGTVKLSGGTAAISVIVTGSHSSISSWKSSVTYTLNFSLGTPSVEVPTRLAETDSKSTYSGVAVELDLSNYFKNAKTYYLVEDDEKDPLDSRIYTFMTFDGGQHSMVFAASNDNGECNDYVTVTVNVEEIQSGAWLGIETSNGSVNYVLFTDAEGNKIEGLIAYLDGTAIKVNVPRTYAAGGKITATFNLTQNNGLPFITTKNGVSGTASGRAVNNKFEEKTTTLSGGCAEFIFYLYNSNPTTTNNSYTTYKIDYSTSNELPVIAQGQQSTATSSITADQTYTIDLDGLFVDPDEDDTITGWKVSVDGKAPVDAVVDENNVYTYRTNDAGQHTLIFYAKDNYNAVSTEKYTVTLNVANATTNYNVTAAVPEGVSPTFYYSANAEAGTELIATVNDGLYTIEVPTNIGIISWRADGIGMNASVSAENNSISIIKPNFTVKADDAVDKNALVTATHSTLNVAGSENNYLLLGGEKYTFTATPSADYEENWKEGKLENHTLSSNVVEINLINKGTTFTFPYFAELTVSEASTTQGIAPKKLSAVKTTTADYASGTKTATYDLKEGKVYEYRVSVPDDNVNCDRYVTYASTFTKTSAEGITITKEQIEAGEKGRTTIDRDVSSNRGRNVADVYTNINAKGYKKLNVGDEFKLIATRNYWGVNADWLLNKNYYYVEPDFHYTVINENGQENNSVIEIDDSGNITAKGEGSAIVLITYDAMTLNHEPKLSEGALGDYPAAPNDFYGAIWPENTGVFVVSVGAGDSGITTGMTINEDKATGQKAAGKNIDAELDVIYFLGEKGEYTFIPGTEGVSVFVANPVVSDKMSFTGFTGVSANEDGSVTVPLTTGRNIVKLVKAGKTEYQVITAKSLNVTVNGVPLEYASLAPGQKVKIEFDNLFAPVNRMAVYNTASSVVYSEVSGWDGKLAGNERGSYGEYAFASYAPKRVVEHFITAGVDGSGYSNSQVTTSGELTVPENYEGEYFTLSNGSFNVGGFTPYLLGSHYEKLGITPPANTSSNNVNCYLGRMPDISVHVGPFTKTTVSEDGKTFTVTPVGVENGKTVILALYDGDKYIEMQNATYEGNEIPFTTTKAYTSAKVMVWNGISDLKPICASEIVKLHY